MKKNSLRNEFCNEYDREQECCVCVGSGDTFWKEFIFTDECVCMFDE